MATSFHRIRRHESRDADAQDQRSNSATLQESTSLARVIKENLSFPGKRPSVYSRSCSMRLTVSTTVTTRENGKPSSPWSYRRNLVRNTYSGDSWFRSYSKSAVADVPARSMRNAASGMTAYAHP